MQVALFWAYIAASKSTVNPIELIFSPLDSMDQPDIEGRNTNKKNWTPPIFDLPYNIRICTNIVQMPTFDYPHVFFFKVAGNVSVAGSFLHLH